MHTDTLLTWTRRDTLRRLTAAAGVGIFGLKAHRAVALPQLETSNIRLFFDPDFSPLCFAPQYLTEEFLKLEGFSVLHYDGWGGASSAAQVLEEDRVDIAAELASAYLTAIDQGAPIVVLAGLHAGCAEMFASSRVTSVQDLAGKRVVIGGVGGPEQVFISTVISYVGLDPNNDIEWVVADYDAFPDLLEAEDVDIVFAFPPLNLQLRERDIGHVILNTTTDDPWRHFFCCMVAARREFVRDYPIATKAALRAFVKAGQLCDIDKEGAARRLVERGVTNRLDYALKTLQDVPYGAWRTYDPQDTMRFFALRLREVGQVESTPNELLEQGTDFRFIEEIRQELKL